MAALPGHRVDDRRLLRLVGGSDEAPRGCDASELTPVEDAVGPSHD